MPRLINTTGDASPGHLIVELVSPGCADVDYMPPRHALLQMGVPEEHHGHTRTRLLQIDANRDSVTIFPIKTTNPRSDEFLKPKYRLVDRITIADQALVTRDSCPTTQEEVMAVLESLESCFIKDFDFGLGLTKDFLSIIEAVENLSGCTAISISGRHATHIAPSTGVFCLSANDFDRSVRDIRKTMKAGRAVTRNINQSDIYNYLASRVDQPQVSTQIGRDALEQRIVNLAEGGQDSLTASEQGGFLNLFSRNVDVIAETHPAAFANLRSDIEAVTLTSLIRQYESLYNKRSSQEAEWQLFFKDNPMILALGLGHPVIMVQAQASVGGRKFDGSGETVVDFLYKNKMTNNAAIIEIKRPSTSLVRKSPYRAGVYAPTSELTGSISQALDQKTQFEQEMATRMHNSGITDLEGYSVHCCLIIGKMPEEEGRQKGFEQYRGNSKSVFIVTFDEVLEKLKQISDMLKGETNDGGC